MTPSAILLTTCVALFFVLSCVFFLYLFRLAVKDKKKERVSSTPAVTSFKPSGKIASETLGNPMPQYQLAKAK